MSGWDKASSENATPVGYYYHKHYYNQYPSFSSCLLDEIYRSIDGGGGEETDSKFYRPTSERKEGAARLKSCRIMEQDENLVFLKPSKRGEMKIESEKKNEGRCRNSLRNRQYHDALLFTSSSSDSSSSGFSSSDTEGRFGKRMRNSSCFAPSRPKPIRTGGSKRFGKEEHSRRISFPENRDWPRRPEMEEHLHDSTLIKSKTRATKIYNQLKKVKQPISPGGKLANFINSLFASKKPLPKDLYYSSSQPLSFDRDHFEKRRTAVSSSFSRSCLSKNSPDTRQRLRKGTKRNVTFCPVNLVGDDGGRTYLHNRIREGEQDNVKYTRDADRVPVSLPCAWKIGTSPARKEGQSCRVSSMEKTRRSVQRMAREILKEYENRNTIADNDDDVASCSSSDLFELDQSFVIGNDDRSCEMYCEELPVYGTTLVDTDRALAQGLIV